MPDTLDIYRTGKVYTVTQATRYAGTTAPTVRRWITGYDHDGHAMAPVFPEKTAADGESLRLSFLDLAEIVVAARFTQHGGRLEKVRQARRRALHDYPDLEYPFANLHLKQLGGEILHIVDKEMGGKPIALSLGGMEGKQYALPGYAEEALDLFDFDPLGIAERWFPAGRDVPVVIDPRFGGAQLTIVGHAIRVETITARFFEYKEDMAFIGHDLGLSRDQVEAVVQYAEAPD